jgi:hypothetical protein
MSRTFTALAFVAALGVALPAAAQTISITIEGDARITIEQTNPPLVGLHHTPEQIQPVKPRHPNWGHKPGLPNWGMKPGHWMERNEQSLQNLDGTETPRAGGAGSGPRMPLLQGMVEGNGVQHQEPNTPAHVPQPTQQMDKHLQNGGKPTAQQPTIGKPGPNDGIVVTPLPDRSTCDSKALEALVGETLPNGSKLTDLDLGSTVRVLQAGQPYTLDKRNDRATLVVDSKGVVQNAYCD